MDYEEGDRVAWMRVAPLSGDIQIVRRDGRSDRRRYQVVIRFSGGDEFTLPVGELPRCPSPDEARRRARDRAVPRPRPRRVRGSNGDGDETATTTSTATKATEQRDRRRVRADLKDLPNKFRRRD